METSITDFLDNEYIEYPYYVLENRAIPSMIDGFKTTQRKITETMRRVWPSNKGKAMKVVSLTGELMSKMAYHHGDCLDETTEILLHNGEIITIKEWFEKYPDLKLEVISYDEITKEWVCGVGHSPRIGQITDIEIEIEMEDGSIFKCTSNHPFYTQRGWVNAENLTENDEILSISVSP